MPKRKADGPPDRDDNDYDTSFAPTAPAKTSNPNNYSSRGFNFNLTSAVSTSISSNTNTTPTSTKDFSNCIKDLNGAFISTCRSNYSKNPSHSLLPMVKEYLYHTRVLMERHRVPGADGGVDLVNGMNSPVSKSFQSLGEFFDAFEKDYVLGSKLAGANEPSVETIKPINKGFLLNSSPSSSSISGKSENLNSFSGFNSPSSSKFPSPVASLSSSPSTSTSGATSKINLSNAAASASAPNLKFALEHGISNKASATSTASFIPNPLARPSVSQPAIPFSAGFPSTPNTPIVSNSTTETTSTNPTAKAPFSTFSFFAQPTPPSTTTSSLNSTPVKSESAAINDEKKNEDEEDPEDDEPPKVEVNQVTEDDAIYSIRCKVLGVVDGQCKDKGIGMLYLKKIDGGKHQIVVRADNNLGTVILNILLQKSLPLERKTKNSIMTVDLQANKKKGMPVFLKVKSEGDATELLEKLKTCQSAGAS